MNDKGCRLLIHPKTPQGPAALPPPASPNAAPTSSPRSSAPASDRLGHDGASPFTAVRSGSTAVHWLRHPRLSSPAPPTIAVSPSSLSDFRRKSFVFNDGPFQLETVNTVI